MLTVIFGLSGALVFGSGDFLGGMASKRMGAFLATGVAGVVGLFVLFGLSFIVPGEVTTETIFGASFREYAVPSPSCCCMQHWRLAR